MSEWDKLTELWKKAEEEIRKLQPNQPIHVTVSHQGEGGLLGYVKYKKGWRLSYKQNGDERWKPLSDCSLHIKVICAPYFNTLRVAVERHLESVDKEVEKALVILASQLKED